MPESIDNTLNKVRSYRENPAINQSYLKNLVLPRIYKEESALFAKGDYIDMALTYPEIDLREHFAISNVNRPSDTIIAICQKLDPLIEKIQDIEDLKDFITEDMLGDYYQNRSLESRIKSFLEAGKEWLKFRIENKGKQFLTEKEVSELDWAILKCKRSETWKTIIKNDPKFQFDFYWNMEGVDCKGLADIVLFNNANYEIDIKFTTARTLENWVYIMKELHYPFQKAFYYDGLKKVIPDTDVKSFWLVVSPYFTHLVSVPVTLLKWGRDGYVTKYGSIDKLDLSKRVPGYLDAIKLHLCPTQVELPEQISSSRLMSMLFKNSEV